MIRGSLVRVTRGNINFATLLGTTAMAILAVPAFAQDTAAQDANRRRGGR